jgi:hypothetical protein
VLAASGAAGALLRDSSVLSTCYAKQQGNVSLDCLLQQLFGNPANVTRIGSRPLRRSSMQCSSTGVIMQHTSGNMSSHYKQSSHLQVVQGKIA